MPDIIDVIGNVVGHFTSLTSQNKIHWCGGIERDSLVGYFGSGGHGVSLSIRDIDSPSGVIMVAAVFAPGFNSPIEASSEDFEPLGDELRKLRTQIHLYLERVSQSFANRDSSAVATHLEYLLNC